MSSIPCSADHSFTMSSSSFSSACATGELLPVRPNCLDQAREILDAVIEETAARYYDDLAPAIDRVWEDGIAAIRADLREWLRRASEDESGYVPWYFETVLRAPAPRQAAPGRSALGPWSRRPRLRHPASRLDRPRRTSSVRARAGDRSQEREG